MRILVTGNQGYIGRVLVEMLLKKSYSVVGFDTNYYRDCDLIKDTNYRIQQITKDMRDISMSDLRDIDAVIHLAALSNDPLGELNPEFTESINYQATMRLAKYAKKVGIRRFVFASSQSIYGISSSDKEIDEDSSVVNPITSYARAKWHAERELKKLEDENFAPVFMRPSTVFGASSRLRCDIVFNNFVSCAYTTGQIEIKSDGTPWRPVVHVRDVSMAFIAAIEAPASLVSGHSFNVGIQNGNYTVRELAEAAQRAVPGSSLIFTGELGADERTYRVCFSKIFSVLGNYYKPKWDLITGGNELTDFFNKIEFSERQFRGKACNRLKTIQYLLSSMALNESLRWNI